MRQSCPPQSSAGRLRHKARRIRLPIAWTDSPSSLANKHLGVLCGRVRRAVWRKNHEFYMPCVYIIKSQTSNRLYVGSSRKNSSLLRLKSHNGGKVPSTRPYRPWILFREEYYQDYKRALIREIFLKSGSGRKVRERWQSGLMRQS